MKNNRMFPNLRPDYSLAFPINFETVPKILLTKALIIRDKMHSVPLVNFPMIKAAMIVFIMLGSLTIETTQARQFRRMAPIPVQPSPQSLGPLSGVSVLAPSGSSLSLKGAEELMPLDDQLIATEVHKIVKSWNTSDLASYLHDYFPQGPQLVSVLQRDTPHDARLQLLSIQNISTLDQVWAPVTKGQTRSRISTVVATVKLQLRFIDPFKGLVTLPHTSQFYLRVVETEERRLSQ